MRRELLASLVFFLLFYFLMVAYYYVGQRSYIYLADTSRPVPALSGLPDMYVMTAATEDGLTLQGWYAPPKKKDKPVIVMFHGNGGNIGGRASNARPFLDRGYGFLLAEYRGYGGNPGAPSEEGLYADARAHIKWLQESGMDASRIVLYGESLGSGVAVHTAAMMPGFRALVLQAPYTTLTSVAQGRLPHLPVGLMMKDRYESIKKIRAAGAPLLVLHGRLDTIVPYEMGQRLYNAAAEPKTMETFPLAGHNDLYAHGAAAAILSFLENLDKL